MKKRLLVSALAIMMIAVTPVWAATDTAYVEQEFCEEEIVEESEECVESLEDDPPTSIPGSETREADVSDPSKIIGSTTITVSPGGIVGPKWTTEEWNPKNGEYTSCTYKAVSSSEVTLKKYKTTETKIKIPASVTLYGKTYKVTVIGPKALKGNKKLKSVTIGKNVKKIDEKAFAQCPKLTKITVTSKVKTIGKRVFYNCKSLKTITIKSKKLKSVGKDAITKINKKATIYVPQGKKKNYIKLFTSKTGFKKTMKIKKS